MTIPDDRPSGPPTGPRRAIARARQRWEPRQVRVLCSTTANDGHFGPLLPFARALVAAGHEVRVAAPASYDVAVARVGLPHEPFGDAPPELVDPVMAQVPTLAPMAADEVVVREVFARIDAQAALPGLLATMERWRPDLVLRESAEIGSLVAAERHDVPHVHVCIGMHEVADRFTELTVEPLAELGRLGGLAEGRAGAALELEPVLRLVPEMLDHAVGAGRAVGEVPAVDQAGRRFHPPAPSVHSPRPPEFGDPDRPLVYVTFGSVTGSIPPFAGSFRTALDALADLDAQVLMTVGRRVDPETLGPLPANARVEQWRPQEEVLPHAAALLGHGGFGTTMGALAAGVPQVVAPLFAFDQAVNGEHVAAVGAGLTTELGPDSVARVAPRIAQVLADPSYAESARRVAAALRALPTPDAAVPLLAELARS